VLYVNYGRLAGYLWRQHRVVVDSQSTHAKASTSGGPSSQTSSVAPETLNIIKMLVTVAVLFLVSWVPYFIVLTTKVRR